MPTQTIYQIPTLYTEMSQVHDTIKKVKTLLKSSMWMKKGKTIVNET